MPYQPVTAKLDRGLRAFSVCVIFLPIGALTLLAVSMELNSKLSLREHLPPALEPGYFYRGDADSPMGLVRFSISRNAASMVRAEGKAFLNRAAGPGWRPTPLPIKEFRPLADCGGFWCSGSDVATEATQWVSRTGSFVLLSSETNTAAIIVNPAERAVIFGYYID
jgi:hypothetical protein